MARVRKSASSKRTNSRKISSTGPGEKATKLTSSSRMLSKEGQSLKVYTGNQSYSSSSGTGCTSSQAWHSSHAQGQSIPLDTGTEDFHSGILGTGYSPEAMHSAVHFNLGSSRQCSPSAVIGQGSSACAPIRSMQGLTYNLKSKASPTAHGPYCIPSDYGAANGFADHADDVSCTSPLLDGFPEFEPLGSLPMASHGSFSGYSDYLGAHTSPEEDHFLDGAHLPHGFHSSEPMSVSSSKFENSSPESCFNHLATPLSMPLPDDTKWPYVTAMDGRDPQNYLSLEQPDAFHLPPSSYPYDLSLHSPGNPYSNSGLPVPGVDLYQEPQLDGSQPHSALPCPYSISRRTSAGDSTANARKDPLYQAPPRKDGLYHCPFEATGECDHQPQKLKCNYHKHLDSHLKPYACDRPPCEAQRFSSTACLLRHEREAHALHGHGNRPFACQYPDCDRAQPHNGFPRQWNLRDHMKRVHGHGIKDPSPPKHGYPSPPNSPDGDGASRRRKQPEQARTTGPKKTKAGISSKGTKKDGTTGQSSKDKHFASLAGEQYLSLSDKDRAKLNRCAQEGGDIFRELTYGHAIY